MDIIKKLESVILRLEVRALQNKDDSLFKEIDKLKEVLEIIKEIN